MRYKFKFKVNVLTNLGSTPIAGKGLAEGSTLAEARAAAQDEVAHTVKCDAGDVRITSIKEVKQNEV